MPFSIAASLAFLAPKNPAAAPTKAPTPAPIGPRAAPAAAPFIAEPPIIPALSTLAEGARPLVSCAGFPNAVLARSKAPVAAPTTPAVVTGEATGVVAVDVPVPVVPLPSANIDGLVNGELEVIACGLKL